MKRCSRCGKRKRREGFGPDARRRDGRTGVCRACLTALQRERKATHQAAGTVTSHGLSGYNVGCRCATCQAAKAESFQKYVEKARKAGTFRHGATGYNVFGCRCEECRAPVREKERRARARQRASVPL